jgi:hypothetical protein
MKRFLAQTALLLLANAIALVVAALFLPGFAINARGFVVAVCFTASTILEPLISKFARQSAYFGWHRPCHNLRRIACNHARNEWPEHH